MRRAVLPLGLLSLAALPAAASPPALVLSGEAHDEAGAPLAGARVELFRLPAPVAAAHLELLARTNPDPAATATSASDGRYRLAVPEAGMWSVRIAASGRVPVDLRLVPLLTAIELPPATLAPAVPTTVRVRDAAGRPVAGARIRLAVWRLGLDPWGSSAAAFTGADGSVAIPTTRRDRYIVHALAPGWLPAEGGGMGGAPVDLRLGAGCGRTVEAHDRQGRPVADA
ncbi:MAG TPA: carboxypeptidase-like regulatory domain-containing protein, partial [Thermoanaerobaculia bacterium]